MWSWRCRMAPMGVAAASVVPAAALNLRPGRPQLLGKTPEGRRGLATTATPLHCETPEVGDASKTIGDLAVGGSSSSRPPSPTVPGNSADGSGSVSSSNISSSASAEGRGTGGAVAQPATAPPLLWLPFWRGLTLPLAGTALVLAQLEHMLLGALPSLVRPAWGAALVLSVLADIFPFSLGLQPSLKVAIEEGSCHLRLPPASSPTGGVQTDGVQLSWTCASMQGWRPSMEDAHVATTLALGGGGDVAVAAGDLGQLALFAVFDGHGGWQVSEVAKQMLPAALASKLRRESEDSQVDLGALLSETVKEVDERLLGGPLGVGGLLSKSFWHPFSSVGSTCCIAALDPARSQIVVSNTGDSRAIVCREGRAVALSEDHKPEDPVEYRRIVGAGGGVVRTGPCYRIDYGLNLSRALGDFEYKANDKLPLEEQKVVATPDLEVHHWEPRGGRDEFLVVACDGLFEKMSRQDVVDYIRRGLREERTPRDVLEGLLFACCARSPRDSGQDNETAILVQWS